MTGPAPVFLRGLGWGVAYRLTLRSPALVALVGASAVGAGLAARGHLGATGPAAPPAITLVAATLMVMAGGGAAELRSGRGALFVNAADGTTRWLVYDAFVRLAAVAVLAVGAVAAGAVGATSVGGIDEGLEVLRALPFLLTAAWALGGLAHVFGSVSPELDALWTVLWAFPVSVLAVGLTLAAGGGWAWWMWACFPIDGLAELAPARSGAPRLLPGPDPHVRVLVFTATAWVGGTVAGIRSAGPNRAPPVRTEARLRRSDTPPAPR